MFRLIRFVGCLVSDLVYYVCCALAAVAGFIAGTIIYAWKKSKR